MSSFMKSETRIQNIVTGFYRHMVFLITVKKWGIVLHGNFYVLNETTSNYISIWHTFPKTPSAKSPLISSRSVGLDFMDNASATHCTYCQAVCTSRAESLMLAREEHHVNVSCFTLHTQQLLDIWKEIHPYVYSRTRRMGSILSGRGWY